MRALSSTTYFQHIICQLVRVLPWVLQWQSLLAVQVAEFCLELALPVVVFLLGLCFSAATLVSLWQQRGCGEGEDDMCMA